jgi:CRISPR-associated protein (TIGR02710 family)
MSLGTGQGVEHGIAFSIRAHNPDEVWFLATEQSKETIPKIESELSYNFKYSVFEATDPDDVEKCYFDTRQIIKELLKRGYSLEQIYIDFTSGTKAMSAGVAWAGTFLEVQALVYVAGKRERGQAGRVISGTERLITLRPVEFIVDRLRRDIVPLFNSYQFEACLKMVRDVYKRTTDPEITDEFKLIETLINAYLYWDIFNHKEAHRLLLSLPKQIHGWQIDLSQNKGFINRLVKGIERFEATGKIEDKYSEFLLADLLVNTERRAREGKYDDAVARLYRTVELIAQLLLSKKGIDTSNVDVERLPQGLKERYEAMRNPKGVIEIAQAKAYQLLEDLGVDIGRKFKENKTLRNSLKQRNHSILAHGLAPVASDDYETLCEEVNKLAVYSFPELTKLKTQAEFPELSLGE